MTQRRNRIMRTAGAAVLVATLGGGFAAAQAAGPRPDPQTCDSTTGHRREIGAIVDGLQRGNGSPNSTAVRMRVVESALRKLIVQTRDDDKREQFQNLLDDLSAASSATLSNADQLGEVTAVLADRVASFNRRCP